MKKLLLAILLALPSGSWAGWASAGLQTAPAANAILADTGDISSNVDSSRIVRPVAICSCEATCIVVFEHRNAADTANVQETTSAGVQVHAQGIFIAANKTERVAFDMPIPIANNESFRIRLTGGLAAGVRAWCSIIYE